MLGQNLKIRNCKLELGYIPVTFILYDFYSQYTMLRGLETAKNFDTYLFDLLMVLNIKLVT